MSGVVATLLVWLISVLYESRYSQPLPWFWFVFVAFFFTFLACYFTWREQEQRIRQEVDNNHTSRRKINALNTALQSQLDDILHNLLIGLQSPYTPPEKLAHLQRHRHHLQRQFQYATLEERIILTKKLALLEKQRIDLTPAQRPSQQYREQFYDVVKNIEELNAQLEQLRQSDHEEDTQ